MSQYPLNFDKTEIERLALQSQNLADEILPKLACEAKSCVEIGCGVGSNLESIRKLNSEIIYTGVDISEIAINHANSKYKSVNFYTKFIHADACNIPLPNENTDLVVLRLVLWSTKDRLKILKEAFRILKPNGILYCYEPDDQFLITFPEKINFKYLVSKWQANVQKMGADPFVGRKINDLISKAGFSIQTTSVQLFSYGKSNEEQYLSAFKNLWNLFSPKGFDPSNLNSESKEWELAKKETEICQPADVLTEGYFIVTAKKMV